MIVRTTVMSALDGRCRQTFDALLAEHRIRLLTYIVSLVPHWSDADEIFQETSLRLWEDFARFESGSDFVAWASRIAYFQVLTFRKRKRRERVEFGQAFVEALATERPLEVGKSRWLETALAECLGRLRPEQRALIELRYMPGTAIEDVATQTGRTVQGAYKALARIRKLLHDCIRRRGLRQLDLRAGANRDDPNRSLLR